MPASAVGDKLRRFFLSHEELEAEDLRDQATQAGAQMLAECQHQARVTLRGTVTSVTSDAKNGWLEAEVNDGSGTVRLIWMGRDRIACLLPGRTLRVHGRLAEQDGAPVIYNPEFEVIP